MKWHFLNQDQMFVGCNDFMGAIHRLHHMKCDLILIC